MLTSFCLHVKGSELFPSFFGQFDSIHSLQLQGPVYPKMGLIWVYPDSPIGSWLPPVLPGKGRPGRSRACCCDNPALSGLLPSDPGCLVNPFMEGNNQPTPQWVLRLRPQLPDLWRPLVEEQNCAQACSAVQLQSSLNSPPLRPLSTPPSSLLLWSLFIHPDCMSTGCQALAMRWEHRLCLVTMTLSLPQGAPQSIHSAPSFNQ